ncbi:MAG: hypothetical protein LBE07_06665, partial [Gordonia sp. (in: high G+C Gram-positive bacteria)]|nr:hypothetical protein [Gordonia sp. (in: high G+C Gram-positive bacteria)]
SGPCGPGCRYRPGCHIDAATLRRHSEHCCAGPSPVRLDARAFGGYCHIAWRAGGAGRCAVRGDTAVAARTCEQQSVAHRTRWSAVGGSDGGQIA